MASRILIIEDAPANIRAISTILQEQGYQISVATNGRQALEVLARIRPDLILLDIMMPEMDGFETCRQIKATTAWREIPLIFLTARSGTADIVRGFELGAVDYVAKPFNAPELIARVRTHLTLDHLHRENERLLLNVLPASIARKLKLEKIKTIGDAYMVAGGLIEPDPEHLAAMANLALAMLEKVRQLNGEFGGLNLRIGLQVGGVIAGVIGIRKFIYDIWGVTVNTASRLESPGAPGRIHVSDTVFQRLQGRFSCTPRGPIELKGLGVMNTYFLDAALPGKTS